MCFHSLTEQKIIHLAGIISKTNTHLGGIASVLGGVLSYAKQSYIQGNFLVDFLTF